MVVRSCKSTYIVPTLSILETMAAEKDRLVSILGKGEMIKVRDKLIPLIRLSSLFKESGEGNRAHVALIVEDMVGHRMAVLVDEILGQQQVVIKNLGSGIGEVPGVSGGAIMSDGNVSLILDVGGLMKLSQDNYN